MNVSNQIKKFRERDGYSQEFLAEKMFVSRQTISNWENNKNYPDVKSLLLLSSLFSVSLDILVKGDLEEMKEKIKSEDIKEFNHLSSIFAVLLLATILLPVPLVHFFGKIGMGIWGVIAIVAFCYSLKEYGRASKKSRVWKTTISENFLSSRRWDIGSCSSRNYGYYYKTLKYISSN